MMYTRFVLYTALAIVTYMLLLAWNADYPRAVNEPAPVPAAALPQQPDTEIGDLPVDVPAPVPASPAPSSLPELLPAPAAQPVTGQRRLITVNTDTQIVNIDLNGGDIVYLALPQHLRVIDNADDPFVLLETTATHTYVAESGLIGSNGVDSNNQRAAYQTSASSYTLGPDDSTLDVDLVTVDANGVQVTKRFTFSRGSYVVDVSYIIDNRSAAPWQANVFGQLKRNDYPDPSDVGGFGRSFLGFATTSPDDPYIKLEFEDVADGVPGHQMTGGWMAFSQHYFLSAWIPDQTERNAFSVRRNSANQYFGSFVGPTFVVEPGTQLTRSVRLYAGPTDQYSLGELAANLNLTIDYGVLWFLASPIYWLLTRIENVVGNYGVAIILLTVVVKALFYKLTETQYKSMAGMRRVMPKMQQLKESYGDDKVKLQKATMELYKKEKINPFGGCLPMLVQMPVFIALYWMLMRSVELRHAPFVLWINDLSVMDPYFVLPLLMGASMYIQTHLSPAPADPMQAKVMKFMPIMMTVFFLWFPAGLVLYWLVNSVLGIAQQWYITRKIEAAYEAKGG